MTTRSIFDDQPAHCPHCQGTLIVPIIYSSPSDEMRIAEKLGHLVLRQASAAAGAPEWKCLVPECNQEF